MSDETFARIARMVERTCGIVLADHKKRMIGSRLSRRLNSLGLPDFDAYLAHLQAPEGAPELEQFVNAVTTNLSSFFRESHHFAHLRDVVMPPLLAAPGARIRIWSAGCSTGEEPHSIAMTVADALSAGADLKILATDIDTAVLEKAKRGLYDARELAAAPPDLVRRHVRSGDDGTAAIDPALRGAIVFRRLNLFDDWPMRGPFDAIFCRNVLIYFGAAAKAELVTRFARILKPGGALYLGHSEALMFDHPQLASDGRTIYRRRE